MGIKKIKELVSKVKEVKNIFTTKKIESPYDKVTIHIKDQGVESVGYILHPGFLKALIKAVKEVKIGQASALKPLNERWGKLTGPFLKILGFLIEQYKASEQTNANFISNKALEALTNDISSLMEEKPALKEIKQLSTKQAKLTGLKQKIDECTKAIENINRSIKTEMQRSKAFLETVKNKIKEEYNQYLSQEKEKLSKNSIAAPIDFSTINNLGELAKYITKLREADVKISDQCNELAYDGLEAFNTGRNQKNKKTKDTELHILTTHPNADLHGFRIVNMFKNWELKFEFGGRSYTNGHIEALNPKLKTLKQQVQEYNRETEEKNKEVKKLESFSDFDSMLGKTYSAKDATKLPTAYIYLYKIVNGDDRAEEKALKTCLKIICESRQDSFDTDAILHAISVAFGYPNNPTTNEQKKLVNCEEQKKKLIEEKNKIEKDLAIAHDQLEKAKKSFEVLSNTLTEAKKSLDDKLRHAYNLASGVTDLIRHVQPLITLLEAHLQTRNEQYQKEFKTNVSTVQHPEDYANKIPLLQFCEAFYRDLETIYKNIKFNADKGILAMDKTVYSRFFACYDLEVPVMNDIIQINFISTARKFITWIQSFVKLTENSNAVNPSGCMELLENYENHPYRKMLLKVQKNK